MREIKFRALDKIDKKIYKVIGIDWYDKTCKVQSDDYEFRELNDSIFDDLIFIQFTGLKANGKEIYEGDMIKISDSDMEYFPEDGEDFIVKWFKDCCGFWIWHIESNRWWDGDMNPFSYEPEIEIIGNIYENPELIK